MDFWCFYASKWVSLLLDQERIAFDQERVVIEQEKLRVEQLKEEKRIFMIDTTSMPQMQAEYIRRRQMKI